jgi:hypothetical protein
MSGVRTSSITSDWLSAVFFSFCGGDLARRVVGHRGGTDIDVGRQRLQHGIAHLRGRAHVHALHAGGVGSCTGPLTSTTCAPIVAAAAARAKPILPLLRLPT